MINSIFLLIFFVFATLSHALFLIIAKSSKANRKLRLWNIHIWFNGIIWSALTLFIILVQFNSGNFKPPLIIQIVGMLLCIGGLILVSSSFKKLGFKQTMGHRFFVNQNFKWISLGLYSFLQNPMYDGFILILVSLGLILGKTLDFYIAIESFILLNIFLASIENKR